MKVAQRHGGSSVWEMQGILGEFVLDTLGKLRWHEMNY